MKTVILDRRGEIAWVRMNRPEALNAFDEQMDTEMLERIEELRADRVARVAILSGEGRAFSTGIDLKALGAGAIGIEWFRRWHQILHALEDLPIPLVIAARGHCLGGGLMLLLTGDYRIAGDDLQTGLSAVKHGIIPGSGPYRLPEAVGSLAARRLCLFAEYVNAQEALRMGLVDQVVPADKLDEAALSVAERAAGFSRTALIETKRLLMDAPTMKRGEYERAYLEAQERCLRSGDVKPWRTGETGNR
jgi:enoyl-CoA hydratase/carnithine racemase